MTRSRKPYRSQHRALIVWLFCVIALLARLSFVHIEPLGPEVWERALSLSRRRSARLGTRTLDVLHVAAALVHKPDVFYTFDERQRQLARAERLSVLPA